MSMFHYPMNRVTNVIESGPRTEASWSACPVNGRVGEQSEIWKDASTYRRDIRKADVTSLR